MLKGVRCVRGYIDMDEHQRCQLSELGPPCLIPPTILQMIVAPNREREESDVIFSPSSIQGCQRQRVLTKDHEFYIDVKAAFKAARGTVFHQGLEREMPVPGTLGVIRELRMAAPISTNYGEQVFKGKPDEVVLLRVENGRLYVKITDLKTRSDIDHDLVEADRRHVEQINMYSWLIQHFLPGWLNQLREIDVPELPWPKEYAEHLFLNEDVELPRIDEPIIDELSITYMDMKRPRTFSSKGFLYDEGKMKGYMEGGHWHRNIPVEHEELELLPIRHYKTKDIEDLIRKGIESQIEADQLLAPPLEGDDAKLLCMYCPVRKACIEIGLRENYSMKDQLQYE